jgi:hypothetical protein
MGFNSAFKELMPRYVVHMESIVVEELIPKPEIGY